MFILVANMVKQI